MSKKSQIKGIRYYSKKTPFNAQCSLCKRIINSKNSYYSENTPDELICGKCYSALCVLDNNEQTISAKIIETEKTIYVGAKVTHLCEGKSVFLTECYGKFKCKSSHLILPIKMCTNCNNIFLSSKLYEKHKHKLCKYKFINNKTGKPYVEATLSENYNSHLTEEKQAVEIPASVQWAIKHPFQGGGCSGK